MNHYISRPILCERLRLGLLQSYRIAPPNYGALLDYGKIVRLLNECRVGMEVQHEMPSDILTADELASELTDSGITAHRLRVFSRRKRNPLPHFRFNKNTLRYTRTHFHNWLKGKTK